MHRKLTAIGQFAITASAAFYAYSAARTGAASFDVSIDQVVLFVCAAALFVSPVIAVASIIGAIVCTHFDYTIPAMRAARGQCLACAYPRHAPTGPCSECGSERTPTKSRNVSLGVGLVVCALATIAGGAVAELWISRDEASFKDEVARRARMTGMPVPYARARWWPNQQTEIQFTPTRGFWAAH